MWAPGSNNTLSAAFDGPVVLNLGNHARGRLAHRRHARVAVGAHVQRQRGRSECDPGRLPAGQQLDQHARRRRLATRSIDPMGGTHQHRRLPAAAQDHRGASGLLLEHAGESTTFKLDQDRLGLQFAVTPLAQRPSSKTRALKTARCYLGFPNGQNVTLGNISAHAFAGVPTLNELLLQNFTRTPYPRTAKPSWPTLLPPALPLWHQAWHRLPCPLWPLHQALTLHRRAQRRHSHRHHRARRRQIPIRRPPPRRGTTAVTIWALTWDWAWGWASLGLWPSWVASSGGPGAAAVALPRRLHRTAPPPGPTLPPNQPRADGRF